MTTLLQSIHSLPKEIQILIYEYNVEHRPKMYPVLKLFKQYKPYRKTCESCNITKIALVLYSYSEYCDEFICKRCYLEDILENSHSHI
jgi:superfamily II helicase